MTKNANLQQRLDAIVEHLSRRSGGHPIVPIDIVLPKSEWGARIATCAICERPVFENADYRRNRWRHL